VICLALSMTGATAAASPGNAAPPADHGPGIAISLSVGYEIGPVVTHVLKGKCTLKKDGSFIASGRSTDDDYLLVVRVKPFAGYGQRYTIYPGQRTPASFQLYGPKGLVYSNFAHDPGPLPPEVQTGAVGFRKKGGVLRFAALAPEDEDVSKGVQLVGGMKCR